MTHYGTGLGVFAPANFDQSFSYDNLGRVTSYTSASGNQNYSYDESGNRTSTGIDNHTIDLNSNRLMNTTGPAPAKTNLYDAAGNLLTDGTTTYTYSDRGRLQTVLQGGITTTYTYNGFGQRVKKREATDAGLIQYVYDEQGHLLGEYDVYGNPLQETVYLGDMPIAVLTQTVVGTTTGSVLVDNSTTASVTAVGSWPVATTIAGFQGTNYQTHIATATTTDSFTWKPAMPVAAAGKYWLQARWTADATRATNAIYTLTDPNGVNVKTVNQRSNNNTWVNLGLRTKFANFPAATVKLSTSSLGTVSADAVRIMPAVVTTSVNYIFTDHLNTPRVITRASDNQIVWRWDQADPFGVKPPNENPSGLGVFTYNPRFPGQLYDAETGLYYNYHRNYDPKIGGYTQSDPIGLAGGINTYGYVEGNPVNWVDPLGLVSEEAKKGCKAYCASQGKEVESCTSKEINLIVKTIERSSCKCSGDNPKYENPGHHGQGGPNRPNPNKSKLPDNHEDLWRNSQPASDGKRWTKTGEGKNAQYDRFQNDGNGNWHWNGSSNAVKPDGTPNPISPNDIPVDVKRW
jgi:RHS repeat-associated protein